jgi:hypothetical protein
MNGAHIAIHAAQKAAADNRKEEEEMTKYRAEELKDDWEFKIVRSASNAFKKPDTLRRIVEEEKMAGWELLEKFDDGRLRFKRPVSARRKDTMLPQGIDPYRTQVGWGEGMIGGTVAVVVIGLMGLMVGAIILFDLG